MLFVFQDYYQIIEKNIPEKIFSFNDMMRFIDFYLFLEDVILLDSTLMPRLAFINRNQIEIHDLNLNPYTLKCYPLENLNNTQALDDIENGVNSVGSIELKVVKYQMFCAESVKLCKQIDNLSIILTQEKKRIIKDENVLYFILVSVALTVGFFAY